MLHIQKFSCTVCHTAPSGADINNPNNAVHFRVEDCVLCTVQNCSNDTLAWLTFAVFLFFAVLLLFSLLSWLVTARLLFNSVAVRCCGRSLSSPIRMKQQWRCTVVNQPRRALERFNFVFLSAGKLTNYHSFSRTHKIYATFSYGKIHNQNGERAAGDKHGERENEKREQSSA